MNSSSSGVQLSLVDAMNIFRAMPAALQLSSLSPLMVQLDAQRNAGSRPVYWCFRDGDRCILHSFQLGDNPDLRVRDIQSPYGYGGPLSSTDDLGFLEMADRAFDQWASENLIVAGFFRFHPLVPHSKWSSAITSRNRETVHINLFRPLFEQYRPTRRTDVRRFSESGLSAELVSATVMLEIFPEMYFENMNRVGAASDYYFSASYLESLIRFEDCENWVVYEGRRVAAAAILLVSPLAGVVEYFLGAQTKSAERQRATIGLLHSAAARYQSIGYQYFYLGGGRGVASDDSLLFFKKGFSSATSYYETGSKVYNPARYLQLQNAFSGKVASGRVLFYRD